MQKPTLPQGTRDFAPDTVRKRNYILNTIRDIFELYGFQPLETPAMENIETLMGKYGDEGDKLIFRILNNGLNDPRNLDKSRSAFENTLQGKTDKNLTERALRYDLTIPFARYVAMNHGQIVYPFRRYQVQPVWRADRPQKGRYREFYQCDADVVGSNSLLNEVDLAMIYHDVFSALRMEAYELRINSRKLLAALAEKCGGADKMMDITIAIDKLDKIGIDKVREELLSRNIEAPSVDIISTYLGFSGTNEEKLRSIKQFFDGSQHAAKGIGELEFVLRNTRDKRVNLALDFTLARGLNYYTGIIFEAKAPGHIRMGSIGGGGRYDDLTGLFGVPGIPGVGISFGVDRIYDVLEEMDLFPEELTVSSSLLFFNEGEDKASRLFKVAAELRRELISCEIYPDVVKEEKQFKYAQRKKIPFIFAAEGDGYKIKNIMTSESKMFTNDDVMDGSLPGKLKAFISSHK